MATAPSPITSTPDVPGQPYDATDHGPVGKWASVDAGGSGPADWKTGKATGPFEDGPGPWKQT
jgi:hypothetical protein